MFELFGDISRREKRSYVFRAALVLVGLVALAGAAGFLLNWPPVARLWPFLGYGLVPVFLASIMAAIAAPVIWIGVSGELAALRGGAANLLVTGGGVAAYGLLQSWGDPAGRVQTFASVMLGTAMVAFLLLVASQRIEWRDSRPTPPIVRIAFGVFGLGLVAVSTGLVLRQDVFPWRLDSDTSVVYGIIFLGSAVYFAYGLYRPVWGNAKGQLVGFLAYDLVLIIPFARLWAVAPSLSLAIYLAVIVVSGLLAIGFLLVSPTYRLWSKAEGA